MQNYCKLTCSSFALL